VKIESDRPRKAQHFTHPQNGQTLAAYGDFSPTDSKASCRSFSLIDFPYLPAEKLAIASSHGCFQMILPAPRLLQTNSLPHLSSFACRFRFLQ
jgi:hypothetical protein